ncbi:hypothetical protein, partial [Alicyclobacillus sp.]|uniref:hypothetical protein n=1 Tax=Alicyclobacillus sp. TaxID=61169 RepID=UPI0025C64862
STLYGSCATKSCIAITHRLFDSWTRSIVNEVPIPIGPHSLPEFKGTWSFVSEPGGMCRLVSKDPSCGPRGLRGIE